LVGQPGPSCRKCDAVYEARLKGTEGQSLTVSFVTNIPKPTLTVVDATMPPGDRVVQLMLVDTSSGDDFKMLSDGTVVDIPSSPEFSIPAVRQPRCVGSVIFNVKGLVVKIENYEPYAIAGDNTRTGEFIRWQAELGEYNISATPFTERSVKGMEGEASGLSIKVV